MLAEAAFRPHGESDLNQIRHSGPRVAQRDIADSQNQSVSSELFRLRRSGPKAPQSRFRSVLQKKKKKKIVFHMICERGATYKRAIWFQSGWANNGIWAPAVRTGLKSCFELITFPAILPCMSANSGICCRGSFRFRGTACLQRSCGFVRVFVCV